MGTTFHALLPDPEIFLALEADETGIIVLQHLVGNSGKGNKHNYGLPWMVQEYPDSYRNKISQKIMEGWSWLDREGLIVQQPGNPGEGWIIVTEKGLELATGQNLSAYRSGNLLPKKLLHPLIEQKSRSPFIRGDYDSAVFEAFKQVEIGVRQAGGYAPTDIGVPLMRKAFHPDTGNLTDKGVVEAERQALSDLFAGSIGSYKNPHSHRTVVISDPNEAVEMIVLASHLVKIAESRKKP